MNLRTYRSIDLPLYFLMFDLSLPNVLPQRAKSEGASPLSDPRGSTAFARRPAPSSWMREERSAPGSPSHPAHSGRTHIPAKCIIFLAVIQVLLSTFCPQAARTQEVTNDEISRLSQQLKGVEAKLVSIDKELQSLNEEFNAVTNEINRLKQEIKEEEAKPKGLLRKITGIFGYRKRGRLENRLTESKNLSDKINDRRRKREPLVDECIALTDDLIDKTNLRMTVLTDIVRKANLNDEITVRDEAWKQVSTLWELAEKTREMRSKYAPSLFVSEQKIALPPLLSEDPEELRLWAAILKDEEAKARLKAAELERQIEDLQRKRLVLERMVELSKEIQRRDEERGANSVEPGTANIPWASEREIDEIKERIHELSEKKQEYEANAERFESQSSVLEQRASQIDAKTERAAPHSRGKSEND
jgi:hypothetical protein